MKNIINIILMSLLVLFTAACGDDDENFSGPYRLIVMGPSSVAPGDVKKFYVPKYEYTGAYSWSVTGPAEIVENIGDTVRVEFTEVGDVVVSVANGDVQGHINVAVEEVEPVVSVTYNREGVLSDGQSDTVWFEFAAPIVDPADLAAFFKLNTDSSGFQAGTKAFVSGSLGGIVKKDPSHYYAIYTAGTGNGTPEALFQDIKSTDAFGGVNIDSAFVRLYRVDNIAPVAELTYSESIVMDSTVVTITATFSEPVLDAAKPYDGENNLLINFSGGGVAAQTDTLQATDDPKVYTYEYTVNGNGDGTLSVSLEPIVDLAGNTLDAGNISGTNKLVIDNTKPIIVLGTATGGDGSANISLTSNEAGMGWYIVLEDGADAPTEAGDFSGGLASGMMDLGAGVSSAVNFGIAAGDYDVYFLVQDKAGNMSTITSDDMTVN